ncbi:AraC family transcriptional regulator [Hydromonas duriensis]|uniref:AraC family transcriptional regulator n=1 Tax=Hydromonas duriensis TaxID=1527608 RepID=A0A4R6YBQ4_9BURK|nr:AraC family transcriptional regulator [Hydromonas duriensis]TDR33085.1 AraC family transcriptional regulator [Hydromonas duriensis]
MTENINFWRDSSIPFIEVRSVADGRKVCYEKHSHDTFSIGAVTAGYSQYVGENFCENISAGTVVLMNAREVHACNPINAHPWSYIMFYVDSSWLMRLQHDLGIATGLQLQKFESRISHDQELFKGLLSLYETLIDDRHDVLFKQSEILEFFVLLHEKNRCVPELRQTFNPKLKKVADFIAQSCTDKLTLDVLCRVSDLSPFYLIRAFKWQYGMTPHNYLINCRVQYAQTQLKNGRSIADVALDAGFTDQAHFQRVFKRIVAATPNQYKGC